MAPRGRPRLMTDAQVKELLKLRNACHLSFRDIGKVMNMSMFTAAHTYMNLTRVGITVHWAADDIKNLHIGYLRICGHDTTKVLNKLDWEKIAERVKTKTATMCRNFWEKEGNLTNTLERQYMPWSPEEDAFILKHGISRAYHCLHQRSRYSYIERKRCLREAAANADVRWISPTALVALAKHKEEMEREAAEAALTKTDIKN